MSNGCAEYLRQNLGMRKIVDRGGLRHCLHETASAADVDYPVAFVVGLLPFPPPRV
jgi:hypothetical protein